MDSTNPERSVERNLQALRKAEEHVRRMVGDEFFFDENERPKRVQERMLEMAARDGSTEAER